MLSLTSPEFTQKYMRTRRGNEENMKTTKKLVAFLLTFALSMSMFGANVFVKADTESTKDTITVNLKVEDVDSTLISEKVTLSKNELESLNNTFVVESGSVESGTVEIPSITSTDFTAAHALAKYVTDNSKEPAKDLAFKYGNPSYIKGEKDLDYYVYWSYRVNNIAPADENFYGYNFNACPVKDGDTIVLFRQACYDPNAGDWGAYTNYSWFDKEVYETVVNQPVSVTYSKDDGWGYGTYAVGNETVSVYNGTTLVKETATNESGSVELSFEEPGTYTITGQKLTEAGVPENSHASAVIEVKGAVTPSPSPSTVPTATPSASPSAAPSTAPSVSPSAAPTEAPAKVKKPAFPKKVKATVKKKKVTFSWKKVKTANGYEISVSKKNKKNFKKIAVTKKTKLTKKFKKGTFYVKVRSYVKTGGKKVYSKYSKTIKIKVK